MKKTIDEPGSPIEVERDGRPRTRYIKVLANAEKRGAMALCTSDIGPSEQRALES